MSRPNYPNCPMTPGVIRGVKERQRNYDANPEQYERREKEQREQYEEDQKPPPSQGRREIYERPTTNALPILIVSRKDIR